MLHCYFGTLYDDDDDDDDNGDDTDDIYIMVECISVFLTGKSDHYKPIHHTDGED